MQTLQDERVAPKNVRRTGLTILIAGVVLAAIGLGMWFLTSDAAVATERVDDWLIAWGDDECEGLRSVFSEDAIINDPGVGFSHGTMSWTLDEAVQDCWDRSSAITETTRVGELSAIDGAGFEAAVEFSAHGDRYSALVHVELDGDVLSRLEWVRLAVIGP